MPLFVLHCIDKPDSLALRLETRPAHVAYLKDSGKTKLAGPYVDAAGEPVGTLVVIEVEDHAAAVAFSEADPYSKAGLFSSVDVRPWRLTISDLP